MSLRTGLWKASIREGQNPRAGILRALVDSPGDLPYPREGPERIVLIRFILLFLTCIRYQIRESGKPAKRPLRQNRPFWIA